MIKGRKKTARRRGVLLGCWSGRFSPLPPAKPPSSVPPERASSTARRSRTDAVWLFRETYIFHSPNTVLNNNELVTIGTTPHEGVRACTYRATLDRGRVVSGVYQGNGCSRYAPKLPG